ncbi:MAG: HEAT repeat domain-containing protein [Chlorobia bacterium]|nr:HEAT repeat domain-containing protein [Fimbriimonadaceae bacterium]
MLSTTYANVMRLGGLFLWIGLVAAAQGSEITGRYLGKVTGSKNAAFEAMWQDREVRLRRDGTYSNYAFMSNGKYRVTGNVITFHPDTSGSVHPASFIFNVKATFRRTPTSLVLTSFGELPIDGKVEFTKGPPRKTLDLLKAMRSETTEEDVFFSAYDELSMDKSAHEQTLLQLAQTPGNPRDRYWPIIFLGDLKNEASVLPLMRIAAEEARYLGRPATDSLAKIGDPISIEAIEKSLEGKQVYPRQVFRYAIDWKRMDGKAWVRKHLDKPVGVSRYAAIVLAGAGDKRSFARALAVAAQLPLDDRLDIWAPIAKADPTWKGYMRDLPEIRRMAFEDSFGFLERMAALKMIGAVSDRKSKQRLEKLANKEPDPFVRRTAIEALGEVGDQSSLKLLTALLLKGNQMHRNAAATAIRRIEQRLLR